VASAKTLAQAVKDAWECDSLSAFGGIVGLNKKVDMETAQVLADCGFLECILAPGYDAQALELLKQKKNIRLMELAGEDPCETVDFKKVSGGLLVQDRDNLFATEKDLKVVTKKKPTADEIKALLFGDKVCRHVKSNAIVLIKGTRTVGIGAGQMSRVEATFIAIHKADKAAKGSLLASDAFFPKPDAVQTAAAAGITAIIQPGGSISDAEIIQEADKSGIAMVFSGIRHFKH
jgi:phosphoribosylaminoimidazolecarboxamide formyltransferase/IMP cyclohydrolase